MTEAPTNKGDKGSLTRADVEQKDVDQEISSRTFRVLEEKVLPLVDFCITFLGRKEEGEKGEILFNRRRGAEIGGILQEYSEVNQENLGALHNLLTEYLKDPSKFKIIYRDDLHREKDDFFVQLRSPSLPQGISKDPSRPDIELYFRLVMERPEETEERWGEALERLRSVALSRSAEVVAPEFDKILSEIPDEITLTFGAVQSYEAETGYLKEVFDSGIAIVMRRKRCNLHWAVRVGYEDLISTNPVKRDCMEANELMTLTAYVSDFFQRT